MPHLGRWQGSRGEKISSCVMLANGKAKGAERMNVLEAEGALSDTILLLAYLSRNKSRTGVIV